MLSENSKWQSKLALCAWSTRLPQVTETAFYRMKNGTVLVHFSWVDWNFCPEAMHCDSVQYSVHKSTRMANFPLHGNATKVDCAVLIKLNMVATPQVSYYGQQFMVGKQTTSQKPKLKAFTTAQLKHLQRNRMGCLQLLRPTQRTTFDWICCRRLHLPWLFLVLFLVRSKLMSDISCIRLIL